VYRAATTADPELEQTAWDLEPLVDGEGETGVESRLKDALARSQAFAERYAGKLGELDSAGLAEAMAELPDRSRRSRNEVLGCSRREINRPATW